MVTLDIEKAKILTCMVLLAFVQPKMYRIFPPSAVIILVPLSKRERNVERGSKGV